MPYDCIDGDVEESGSGSGSEYDAILPALPCSSIYSIYVTSKNVPSPENTELIDLYPTVSETLASSMMTTESVQSTRGGFTITQIITDSQISSFVFTTSATFSSTIALMQPSSVILTSPTSVTIPSRSLEPSSPVSVVATTSPVVVTFNDITTLAFTTPTVTHTMTFSRTSPTSTPQLGVTGVESFSLPKVTTLFPYSIEVSSISSSKQPAMTDSTILRTPQFLISVSSMQADFTGSVSSQLTAQTPLNSYMTTSILLSSPIINGIVTTTTLVSGPPITGTVTTTTLVSGPPITGTVTTTTLVSSPPITGTVTTTTLVLSPPITGTVTTTTLVSGPPITETVTTTTLASGPPITETVTTSTLPSSPIVTGTGTTSTLPIVTGTVTTSTLPTVTGTVTTSTLSSSTHMTSRAMVTVSRAKQNSSIMEMTTMRSLSIEVSPTASNGSVSDDPSPSFNQKRAVGIGVSTSAGIAGLIIAIILVLFVWRKHRHKFQGVYYTTETGRPAGETLLNMSVKHTNMYSINAYSVLISHYTVYCGVI